MNHLDPRPPRLMQSVGCLGMALTLFLLCLMPFILLDTMRAALEKLHLSEQAAMLLVLGILLGSVINIPVHRIHREELQPVETIAIFGFWGWMPRFRRVRRDTIVAINVGGCLIPCAIAALQVLHVLRAGQWPVLALLLAGAANVAVCYRVARPVNAVGIMMPGFVSPGVAVGATWLLLMPDQFDPIRAPVAFAAGILGPLVGADLCHLKDITKVSAGIVSIGGAGTFDGIVLSGILAALLA